MFWQLFVNGEHVGDGASVLEMNEAGDLEERLAGFVVRWLIDGCSRSLSLSPSPRPPPPVAYPSPLHLATFIML